MPTRRGPLKTVVDNDARVVGALNRAFATEDGRVALRYLMILCGWAETSIAGDAVLGADLATGTLMNEARRAVYLELRASLDDELLKKVEFYNPEDATETKEEE